MGNLVDTGRIFMGDAEFIFFEPCGDIRMGLRVDIGIDA